MQEHIGDHILQNRPSCVVVETAVTPVHGSASGNEFRCDSEDMFHAGLMARMVCHVSSWLSETPHAAASPLWRVRLLPVAVIGTLQHPLGGRVSFFTQ